MSIHHKISPTAWLIAKIRSEYTDIPFSKEIINAVSGKINFLMMKIVFSMVRIVMRLKPEKLTHGAMIESRYLCTEDTLPKTGDFVIIELAAGLSPRGISHAKKGRTVIETDLPELIEIKKNILNQVYQQEGLPENHHLLSVNVLNPEDMEKLGETYLRLAKGKPLYIIHEGMAIYFTNEEKENFRNLMAGFLRKYAPGQGHWVTPDFSPFPENFHVKTGPMAWLKKITEKSATRQVKSFHSLDEAADFLAKSGLNVKAMPNDHIIRNLSGYKKLKLDVEKTANTISPYRSYLIEPKENSKIP